MAALPKAGENPKLVAVIGTTGVGKTDLGVELAKALQRRERAPFEGEVVNHDSMQCYRGLDIITNKATVEEMQGVPHHLMGFLEPGEEWSVNEFLRDALDKTRELRQRGTLPIAVGGTSYYLQHLVFPDRLAGNLAAFRSTTPPVESRNSLESVEPRSLDDLAHFPRDLRTHIESLPAELLDLFLAFPALPAISTPDKFPPGFPIQLLPPRLRCPATLAPALYSLLQAVDPKSAERWHWRDIRKVQRALAIFWEGKRWDEVVQEQRETPSEGPRFETLIFWIYARKDSLHPRLNARVDRMIERGLLSEIDELWQIANAPGAEPTNYSKGIYQAIGYKEFDPFLSLKHRHPSRTLDNDPPLQRLFDQGVEQMKASTRQYAKRQVQWIKNKLLPVVREYEGKVTIVLLDATGFLDDKPLPDPRTLSSTAAEQLALPEQVSPSARIKRPCLVCTRGPGQPFLVEERLWDEHVKTRTHRMALRRQSKAEWKDLRQRAMLNDDA
ncbi:tRNA dimethylallyltransferase [Rhodotorula toruloides]|uniref:tRNA dimethylallyltransferase n=1 Tax=Rhodotorula toruloides TaxID=5286 RepID=A0A511K9M5_RHOTO|nr:tRNA dimethylallyltransferase [Rhodotorula toruloides]